MTAKQAIRTGKKVVNTPIIILMASPLICLLLYAFIENEGEIETFRSLFIAGGIGLVLSWTYWSFVGAKWLIWAYKKVENKSELYTRAVKANLIWKKGHWANKTLIFSKEEKVFVTEMEQNVYYNEQIKPSEKEMEFFISTPTFLVLLLIISFFIIGGTLVIIENIGENDLQGIGFGALVLCIGVYGLFRKLPFINFPPFISFTQKYFSSEPQIVLSQEGISIRQERTGLIEWKDVKYSKIDFDDKRNAEKFNIIYDNGQEEVEIETDLELLSGDFEEMEYFISHHRKKAK